MSKNYDKIFLENYNKLNPEQKRAVDTIDGPVMVIAGPGTGKTQIIGVRTANLIKHGVDPRNILITTFTDAGVIAIKKRLLEMMGPESYKVTVSTLHSFSQSIISDFPEKFTQEKLETQIDDIDQIEIGTEIVNKAIKEKKLEWLTTSGDPLYYLKAIMSSIGNIRREGISPAKFAKIIDLENQKSLDWLEEKRNNKRIRKIEKYELEHEKKIGKLQELHYILVEYENYLRSKGLYDYNDMILKALDKLESDNELRYHYAEKYQYIMLDEYQDTNNAQSQIIDTILSVEKDVSNNDEFNPNIMVVGDDDQSIYRFQGANIENMLDFITRYPNSEIIVLKTNYRSTQEILDNASSIISDNTQRLINRIPNLTKNLESFSGSGIMPKVYKADSELHEDLFIVTEIKRLMSGENGNKAIPGDEIAIIVRSNKDVEKYTNLLLQNEIPVESKVIGNILENDLIKLTISFLRVILDPYNNEKSFADLLRSSFVDIPHKDIALILQGLYKENYGRNDYRKVKIIDALYNDKFIDKVGIENKEQLNKFIDLFEETREFFADHNVFSSFQYLITEWNLLDIIKKTGNFDDLLDMYTFMQFIEEQSRKATSASIQSLLDRLDLYIEHNKSISRTRVTNNNDGVQILTAHSSKGLEFDAVFIPKLIYGNWDNKQTKNLIKLPISIAGDGLQSQNIEDEKENQHEEARRLFFVAITRARKNLYLSHSISSDKKALLPSEYFSSLSVFDNIEKSFNETELSEIVEQQLFYLDKYINLEESELEYISNFLKHYKLSVSGLNRFLKSPEEFYYSDILRYPFEGNENLLFGNSYHKALELFYKRYKETNKVPEIQYAIDIFIKDLDKYLLKPEEKERLILRGTAGLEGYYEKYKDSLNIPLKTEYRTKNKDVLYKGIPLIGIIDKIELASGENIDIENTPGGLFKPKINIVDYKTGSIKYYSQIKGETKDGIKDLEYKTGGYGRQLLFYKLLYENDPELYNNYELEGLCLDFCEGKNGKYKISTIEFSDEEYQEFKELLVDTAKKIYDIEFWRELLF